MPSSITTTLLAAAFVLAACAIPAAAVAVAALATVWEVALFVFEGLSGPGDVTEP